MHVKNRTFLLALLCAGAFATVRAGDVTFNFDTDPAGKVDIVGSNPDVGRWQNKGGNPATGGFLAVTYAQTYFNTGILFADLDPGKVVTAFTFDCDLRVGNPSTENRAADGFSVSFARANDPVITSWSADTPLRGFRGDTQAGGAEDAAMPETGTTTGISISFDTWSGNPLPDGADLEGIIVVVDNKSVLKKAMATRNGACTDPTSLQTGPRDTEYWASSGDPTVPEAWAGLCWQPLHVQLDADGKLTVAWKGNTILNKYQTAYFPSAGRLVFAGRTGGSTEETHVDNIHLVTTAVTPENQPPSAPANLKATSVGSHYIALGWDASVDQPDPAAKVGYEVEKDGTSAGYTSVTSYQDKSGLLPNTSHTYRVRAVDLNLNKSAWASVTVKTVTDVSTTGWVLGKIYDNITGTSVDDLLADGSYPNSPTRDSTYLRGLSFGEWTGFGATYGDNYGFRLAGTLTAPETAQYDFFARSDDLSRFYLNTSGAGIPDVITGANGGSAPIAEVSTCCQAFAEPSAASGQTTASPISLQAGKQYGFLWLVKEGTGSDYGQVAWRKVGDTTAAASLPPISGVYISPNAGDPGGAVATITKDLADTTAVIGQSVTFAPQVQASSPWTTSPVYQWYKNGTPIYGAAGPSLTIPSPAASDSGTKYKMLVSVPGAEAFTKEITLTVVPDTFPPTFTVSALKNPDNSFDVGVQFNEPVDAAAGTQSNYSISTGTITGVTFYQKSAGAVLKVTGLTAGSKASVTVKNVADAKGNKITSASGDFTAGKMGWGVVGGDRLKLGNGVVAVGDNGFDIYSDGATEWNNYDEATFVYEQITGDFDKKVRVEYQDSSSQWARAGLIARDVTNFGVNDVAQSGDPAGADNNNGTAPFTGKACRYQKVHVNPQTTVMGTAGNYSWEGNRRLETGGPSSSAGGGGTPQYPNAWCRLQREGQVFTIYRSDDGVEWVQLGQTSFPSPMPDTLYVGPDFSPENGNITDESLRGVWLAKFRDYGDTFATTPTVPTLAAARSATGLTLTFTGTLQSADKITGPWADVTGGSPQTVTASGTAKFYRAKQ